MSFVDSGNQEGTRHGQEDIVSVCVHLFMFLCMRVLYVCMCVSLCCGVYVYLCFLVFVNDCFVLCILCMSEHTAFVLVICCGCVLFCVSVCGFLCECLYVCVYTCVCMHCRDLSTQQMTGGVNLGYRHCLLLTSCIAFTIRDGTTLYGSMK